MGEMPIKLEVLIPGIELASKLNRRLENNTTQQRKKRTSGLRSEEEPSGAFFRNEMCDALFLVDEGEEGEPESYDDDNSYDGSEDKESPPSKSLILMQHCRAINIVHIIVRQRRVMMMLLLVGSIGCQLGQLLITLGENHQNL